MKTVRVLDGEAVVIGATVHAGRFGGRRAASVAALAMALVAPVRAGGETASRSIDFATGIVPILTKAGCNSAACHGAATGRGGFKLSLFGGDPRLDYEHITRQFEGRRVNLAEPEQSLFLRKPTRKVKHRGGRRFKDDSAFYDRLHDWLATGAPFGNGSRRVAGIDVTPADTLLAGPGATVQLRVTARYADGSTEDVTGLTLFASNDEGIAAVSKTGLVTVQRRGLAALMIRYLGHAAAVRIGTPLSDTVPDERFAGAVNFIDEAVFRELKRLGIPPSPLSDDAAFLRRVHLDLIGTLPAATEVRAFLAEPTRSEKRRRLVDALLVREEFVDFWTLKWADLLLINSRRGNGEPARALHAWVREQVAANVPLDRFVRALLTARGSVAEHGAAGFYKVASDPRDISEFVSRAFLGIRVQCARCHNHPFDRWTQNDYYGQAAFFARVRYEGPRLVLAARGEVQHPSTGRDVQPAVLTGAMAEIAPDADRRVALADWMTAGDNRMFARAMANRIWKHLLGRGIIEPVDDVRTTNPPANPALLDVLADHFVANGHDVKKLIRTIAASRTYQLRSRTNDVNRADEKLFSHAYLKPLPAAVLADALAQAAGVPDHYAEQPAGTRAVQLQDPQVPSYALDVLGRCRRETGCDVAGQYGGGLSKALHLINGEAVNRKMRGGVIDRLLAEEHSDRAIVETLYLRTVSRFPTDAEHAHWQRALGGAGARREVVEDLFWALLNSREFAFNH